MTDLPYISDNSLTFAAEMLTTSTIDVSQTYFTRILFSSP